MLGIDKERIFKSVNIAIVTISDTRTLDEDKSGATLEKRIINAGHNIGGRFLVKDDVIEIYNKIENRSSILNRSRPQSVASGIVRYYILLNEKENTMAEFRSKVKLSELTINRIVREIAALLDTPQII